MSCWDDEKNFSFGCEFLQQSRQPVFDYSCNAVLEEYKAQPVSDLLSLKEPHSEAHARILISAAHTWGHFGLGSTRKRLMLLGFDMKKFDKILQEEVESCPPCQQRTLQISLNFMEFYITSFHPDPMSLFFI